MQILLDEIVHTDYGQFDLVWDDGLGFDGDEDAFFADQVNGLVGAASPDGVYLVLSRRSGGSAMLIVSHETEPDPAAEEWEDVVEVSSSVPAGTDPGWSTWAGESGGSLAIAPGGYRLRVSSRGRDRGAAEEFAEEIVDHYRVDLWPSPPAPDAIVRVGSDSARYWHQTNGARG